MLGPSQRKLPSLLDETAETRKSEQRWRLMMGKTLTAPILVWTERPSRYWEAHGETLHYRVIDGWRISTLTVRDGNEIVYVRFGDGEAGADLRAAAKAFEVVAALSGHAPAIKNADAFALSV